MTISSSLPPHLLEETKAINGIALHRDLWGALYEYITMELYSGVLREGDVAVDCGVNIGDHASVIALNCGRSGRVYAFEAAPAMLASARKRLESFETIKWIDRAVWSVGGQTMTFDFYPDASGVSSLRGTHYAPSEQINVLTTTLDECISEPVSLIKLDIEGAEYHALVGAARIMIEDRPVIVFENARQSSAERFGYTKDNFFELFNSRGYALYSIVGMPLTQELWEEWAMPWQFVAINPVSPRAASAYAVMHRAAEKLLAFKDK